MIRSRSLPLLTVALLIVVDLPLSGLIRGDSIAATVEREGLFWVLTAVIIVFVLTVERRPLASIGIARPTWKTLLFGVLGGAVATAAIAAIYLIVYPLLHVQPDIGPGSGIPSLPFWLKLAIVVRAAVFEEVFYRGFAIERLTELTRSRRLAAAISLIAFTVAHLNGWGVAHLLVAACGGVVLTGLYLWRRDLVCNTIAHFTTDAIGFLL